MEAAAELIAEVGWGRVTTRAVAAKAGLPHGAVSYHFAGKQQLLVEAALKAFERAFQPEEFARLDSIEEVIAGFETELRSVSGSPAIAALMLEAMREAERDAELRDRLGTLLRRARQAVADVARRDEGLSGLSASPETIAALLIAVGDGLLLHCLIDPELDVGAQFAALHAMLAGA
ncbi:MAG TPA: TetR family transcriptional regulator [Solirubrobacterales bacterium]|nr:TetR family transcriptional regulator [Solirubrobacterales bacterium]